MALLSALADRGDRAARSAIIGLLHASSDEAVRAAAIRALGRLEEPADLPWIVTYLSSKSSAEQTAARAALTQMRGEAINKALAAELSTVPHANQATLIDVLAARRASSELPAFLAASLDDDTHVAPRRWPLLGQLGGADQIAAMLPAILKAQKGSERDARRERAWRSFARESTTKISAARG